MSGCQMAGAGADQHETHAAAICLQYFRVAVEVVREGKMGNADLFLRMGVRRGRRSLMGGVILVMPMTFTMDLRADRMEPSTSGYSSPRYSYSTTPKCPSSFSSSHCCSSKTFRV